MLRIGVLFLCCSVFFLCTGHFVMVTLNFYIVYNILSLNISSIYNLPRPKYIV